VQCARYAAKNIVAAGIAEECEVQLSYSLGLARPVSVQVETFGTGRIPDDRIAGLVERHFDFRLAAIMRQFNLRYLPGIIKGGFYRKLASYGQVGRMDIGLPWELTDRPASCVPRFPVEKTDSRSSSCIDLGGFSWTNIDSLSAASMDSLAVVYPFHPLDLEDCLSKVQLPKIDEYQDYLFIILHFPRYLKEKRFSVPSQVSLFLSRDFLVTVHSGELKPINSLFESLRNKACQPDPDPSVQRRNCMADALGGQIRPSPVFLLYRVIYALVENLHIMTGKVLRDIEDVEDRVFDEKVDAVREVTNLRHNIANFRRIAFPLKRVIHDLEIRIQWFTDEDMEIYFSDLTDYIDKVWHTLEECKETIEIYKDTDVVQGQTGQTGSSQS
jgi:magnesium transporter